MKIDIKDTLYKVISENPSVKDYLVSKGIDQVKNNVLINTVGKKVTLETLVAVKKINKDLFLKEINEFLEGENIDSTISGEITNTKQKPITLIGVLPCPVRLPLLEKLEEYIEENNLNQKLDYDLKAASMGLEWVKKDIEKGEIADVFLSAGFDLFFDKKNIYKLKEQGMFENLLDYEKYNKDFENASISLKDPKGEYSIISAVPAVFLVNKKLLGDKKIPESWEELLSGRYNGEVSLPVGDFDLFNAILLNIYKSYGKEGVEALGKVFLKSMHPSEMVKSGNGENQPSITIMPYFFTRMAKPDGNMEAIWPKDGAIVSPIFMVTKKKKAEEIKGIAQFFGSKEIGEILSHTGLFPSANPEVDNHIPNENKYMWVGWEFIENNDISQLLKDCVKIFNEASGV